MHYLRSAAFALSFLGAVSAQAQYQPQPQPPAQPTPYGQPQGQPPAQTPAPGYAPGPYPAQQPGYGYGYPQPSAPPARVNRDRETWEIGTLYGVAGLYGVGMGLWISAETRISDPGLYAIAPAVLGLAAPVGVYFLDQPKMDRGMPMAITTGMLLGTANGAGLVAYQHASRSDQDAWGYRQLTRAAAIGSTLGAVGGYAAGYYLEPPPESGLMVSSGVLWGSAIGAMFGYGVSPGGKSYNEANEYAAMGGLIGLNAGAVATGALSALLVPTTYQLGMMWLGAGIGAAVSAPIYLFYIGDSRPPARRGLVFTGTTATLGLIAGALLGSEGTPWTSEKGSTSLAKLGNVGEIDYVGPLTFEGGMGMSVGGRLY